jgi:mRNA interferase MazF
MVAKQAYVPSRGDVVWLSFTPQAGHEQAGRRPALVLSPAAYNRRVGLALLCPIASRSKGYPFDVSVPEGFAVSGVVLSDQIRSLDWRARRAELAGRLPDEIIARVRGLVHVLLDGDA